MDEKERERLLNEIGKRYEYETKGAIHPDNRFIKTVEVLYSFIDENAELREKLAKCEGR